MNIYAFKWAFKCRINLFNSYCTMAQVLQGSYYQAAKQGYVNRGRQTIKFASKVNHLPVHSRCNELLRSSSHNIDTHSANKLEEVHCYVKSGEMKSKSMANLSVEKLVKIVANAVQKSQGDIDHRPDQKESKMQNNHKIVEQTLENPQKTEQKWEVNENQGASNKNQKSAAKNSLKQNISLMCLQEEQGQKQEDKYRLNTPKTTFQKSLRYLQRGTRNSSEDQCTTEHVAYERDGFPHQNQTRGEDKILNELSSLMLKVGQFEQKIRKNEELFELKRAKSQFAENAEKLTQLQEQNQKLKLKHSLCPACCRGYDPNYLYLFGMFLFGLIFTKAVFC